MPALFRDLSEWVLSDFRFIIELQTIWYSNIILPLSPVGMWVFGKCWCAWSLWYWKVISFFWLGMQIGNQNVVLLVNQRLKSELILRTAIMGLNCSLRKVISVEKYPEASATKENVPDLKKVMGNHPSWEMQGLVCLKTEGWCRCYLKTAYRSGVVRVRGG